MDPLFQKARIFTDLEDQALLAWVQALNANLNDQAAAVLDAGLYVEHLTSLLPADRRQWTVEQGVEVERATRVFNGVLDTVAIAIEQQERDRAAGSPEQGSGGGDPAPGGAGYGR